MIQWILLLTKKIGGYSDFMRIELFIFSSMRRLNDLKPCQCTIIRIHCYGIERLRIEFPIKKKFVVFTSFKIISWFTLSNILLPWNSHKIILKGFQFVDMLLTSYDCRHRFWHLSHIWICDRNFFPKHPINLGPKTTFVGFFVFA